MNKLLTIILMSCALTGAAYAQDQPPTHPTKKHHTHSATKPNAPNTKKLPPSLRYEGKPTSTDPSAFPGEVGNKGYPGGVPENPR